MWVDLPIGEVIRPYVGGGLGFGRLSLDVETTNTSGGTMYSLVDDSDWGFAYQLGAGVAFDVMANMTFDVGYRYKVINNLEFESDTSTTFDFDADYKSHNILAGIRFNF